MSRLEQAPEEVKLAVDLIYLLEENQIPVEVALSALKIVERDLKRQQQKITKNA